MEQTPTFIHITRDGHTDYKAMLSIKLKYHSKRYFEYVDYIFVNGHLPE